MKLKIGVMGSASGPTITNKKSKEAAYNLGMAIANSDSILVTGACPGLPDDAALGAKKEGGFVMGVSPAKSHKDHIGEYSSPDESYDIILYTGIGLMERDVLNIRFSDALIIVGGGVGSLNEFCIAYDENKIIGILSGTGGISDKIEDILDICNRELSKNIIIDSNPKSLVDKVIKAVNSPDYNVHYI